LYEALWSIAPTVRGAVPAAAKLLRAERFHVLAQFDFLESEAVRAALAQTAEHRDESAAPT
jgi:hypothetical protein